MTSRVLKSTGIATNVVWCYCPDLDGTMREHKNGWTPGSGMTLVGTNPTLGSGTFNGKTVPYIDNAAGGYWTIPDTTVLNVPMTVVAQHFLAGDCNGKYLFQTSTGNGMGGGFLTASKWAMHIAGANINNQGTAVTANKAYTWAQASRATPDHLNKSWYGEDGSTISATDNIFDAGTGVWAAYLINAFFTYLGKHVGITVFNKELSTAEVDSLHQDWFGTLFQGAVVVEPRRPRSPTRVPYQNARMRSGI